MLTVWLSGWFSLENDCASEFIHAVRAVSGRSQSVGPLWERSQCKSDEKTFWGRMGVLEYKCTIIMTKNGTRMHILRPLKPTFFWGRTPRPRCKNFHVACFSGRNPIWLPNIFYVTSKTTLAESKFIKIVEFIPQWIPKCHVFPPKWPKNYKKWPKIGQKWPKISWPKMGFPTGRPARPKKCTREQSWKVIVF